MRRVLAALWFWGAAGCMASPPAAPRAGIVEAAPLEIMEAPAAIAVPAPVERAVEPFPAVAAPAERACSLSSTSWSGDLQVGSGKPVYGSVSRGPTRLSLGSDTRDGSAFAEAASGSLELVGAVDHPRIFSKAPLTLGGFVTPLASTPLGWQPTGVVDRVGVTLDISDTFAVPSMVEKTVSCSKLTLDQPSWNASSFLTERRSSTWMISGNVDLFGSPGKLPIARTDSSYHEVVVLERRGRHSRVAIQTFRYYAVGWVATETLSFSPVGLMGGHRGTGFGSGMSRTPGCRHDLELLAEVAGARYHVGRLRAGGRFSASTLDVADGFTALTLAASWFRVAPAAKLLVRTRDLADC